MINTKNMLKVWKNIIVSHNPVEYAWEQLRNSDNSLANTKIDEFINDFFAFKQYLKKFLSQNNIPEEIRKRIFDPIINIDDIMDSFNCVLDNLRGLKRNPETTFLYYKIDANISIYYSQILSLMSKELIEIKVDIVKKENTPIGIVDGYQEAVKLYLSGSYEKAIQHARDIFQKDLEETFQINIKFFENKEDKISQLINKVLRSISDLRNQMKTEVLVGLNDNESKAITKLTIEQLLNVRNYIALFYDKN